MKQKLLLSALLSTLSFTALKSVEVVEDACVNLDEAQLIERLAACPDHESQLELLSEHPDLARSIVSILAVYQEEYADQRAQEEVKRLIADLGQYLASPGHIEHEVVADYIAQIGSIAASFEGFQASMRLSLGFANEQEEKNDIRLAELDDVTALLCVCRRASYDPHVWHKHTAAVVSLIKELNRHDHTLELDDLVTRLVDMRNDRQQ